MRSQRDYDSSGGDCGAQSKGFFGDGSKDHPHPGTASGRCTRTSKIGPQRRAVQGCDRHNRLPFVARASQSLTYLFLAWINSLFFALSGVLIRDFIPGEARSVSIFILFLYILIGPKVFRNGSRRRVWALSGLQNLGPGAFTRCHHHQCGQCRQARHQALDVNHDARSLIRKSWHLVLIPEEG